MTPSESADSTDARLAVYGTLAPGKPNHHHLAHLPGRWVHGSVNGHLREEGWGAELGFPGLSLDPSGPTVAVQVFESAHLRSQWTRLDEFEGPGYQRVAVEVATDEGPLDAFIYVLTEPFPTT